MTHAKVWIMAKKFHGAPKPSDFAIATETLPALKDGEVLCEAVWWSVDPYNRAYASQLDDGHPMIGFQVAKVTESHSSKYPVGTLVVGHFGWRTHTIAKDTDASVYKVPDLAGLPLSAAVGILGMPGMTSYFGLLECCQPKKGETIVVNAAAGAVGSVVGQIGKILGCTVIGYAGDDEKVKWLKEELGFDHAFNYKKVDLSKSLDEAAPKGVDCFFDNVGGEFAVTVYRHMNHWGRVCQCGAISGYNSTAPQMIPDFLFLLIFKEITLKGFYVSSYTAKYPEAMAKMAGWIKEHKLKHRETVYKGFEAMPRALIELLEGKNVGKAVISA